jgi:hypothetical protein
MEGADPKSLSEKPLILDSSLQGITSAQYEALLSTGRSFPCCKLMRDSLQCTYCPDASRASSSSSNSVSRDISSVPGPKDSKDAYSRAQNAIEHSPRARIGPAESFILLSQSQIETVPRPRSQHVDSSAGSSTQGAVVRPV